jgi:hypothetical protein
MAIYLTIFLVVIDVLIALFYGLDGNFAKVLYWLSAGSITFSTLLMK